jgi:hypothetical protein
MGQQWCQQIAEPVPGDLYADAEKDEGDDAKDAVRGGGRDVAGDLWGVGIAEIDQSAQYDDGDEESDVRENLIAERRLRGVNAQREHDDDAAGASRDGEGERIERLLLQLRDLCLGDGGHGCVGLLRAGGAVFLVQQPPTDHRDHDSAGDLDDGERDAEEAKYRRANQLNDGEEDDGIDGDFAGQCAIGLNGRGADEAEEDQGGAERVDQRQKRAEAKGEVFPEQQHEFSRCEASEAAAILR